jgi:superfamily II DNA/RNA helicase
MNFDEFDLNNSLLEGILNLKYEKATLVQQSSIPQFLNGKDILLQARTGSGKTMAYVIPLLQKLISSTNDVSATGTNGSNNSANTSGVRAIILVPTRELATQVQQVILKLVKYLPDIKVLNIGTDATLNSQVPLILEQPSIVISTPLRLRQHLEQENLNLKSVETLVISELVRLCLLILIS